MELVSLIEITPEAEFVQAEFSLDNGFGVLSPSFMWISLKLPGVSSSKDMKDVNLFLLDDHNKCTSNMQ